MMTHVQVAPELAVVSQPVKPLEKQGSGIPAFLQRPVMRQPSGNIYDNFPCVRVGDVILPSSMDLRKSGLAVCHVVDLDNEACCNDCLLLDSRIMAHLHTQQASLLGTIPHENANHLTTYQKVMQARVSLSLGNTHVLLPSMRFRLQQRMDELST